MRKQIAITLAKIFYKLNLISEEDYENHLFNIMILDKNKVIGVRL